MVAFPVHVAAWNHVQLRLNGVVKSWDEAEGVGLALSFGWAGELLGARVTSTFGSPREWPLEYRASEAHHLDFGRDARSTAASATS